MTLRTLGTAAPVIRNLSETKTCQHSIIGILLLAARTFSRNPMPSACVAANLFYFDRSQVWLARWKISVAIAA